MNNDNKLVIELANDGYVDGNNVLIVVLANGGYVDDKNVWVIVLANSGRSMVSGGVVMQLVILIK